MNENPIPDPVDEVKKESKRDNTPIFLDESVDIPIKKKDIPPPKTTRLTPLIAILGMCCVLFTIGIAFLSPNLFTVPAFLRATSTPTSTLTPMNTSTATITLTPHAMIPASGNVAVFNERFNSNANRWYAYYSNNTTSIQDGKLHLKSDTYGYVGLALCNDCLDYDKAFYFQAEVLPAISTSTQHGIAFRATESSDQYYAFVIDTRYQLYSLYRNTPGWKILFEGIQSDSINKFPASNTLAIKYDAGHMELYINGNLVNAYTDSTPVDGRKFGIFVGDGFVDVIADNVYAYEIDGKPIATPTSTP